MIKRNHIRELIGKALVILGLWIIVVLLISSITIIQTVQEGSSIDVIGIFLYELVCISPWIISTPALIWLARSYRFNKEALYKSTAVHIASALVVFSFHSIIQSLAVFYFYDMPFSWSFVERDFVGFLDMRVILYLSILMVVYAIDYQKKNRAIRLRKSKLKADLSKAKFHALLNKIQPDFMLNSIDAIKERLDTNLEEAEEILTDFSTLLRIMLNSVDREEVVVEQDIKAFHLYVNILGKRLDREINKEAEIDVDCYQALVPSFLLLVPVFERIIQSKDFNPKRLKSITYNARKKGDQIDLGVSIKKGGLFDDHISFIFQKSGFSDAMVSLRSKYGEELEFKTTNEDHLIYIGLKIPFISAKDSSANTKQLAKPVLSK